MRVAVTGGSGVLGTALRAVRPEWHYLSRAECDVRNVGSVYQALTALAPDVVLHAAALTDHQHPNAAVVIDVNIEGTRRVAQAARFVGARLAYVSTHYVYEGRVGNALETNVPRPIGAYAASKLAGEGWVREVSKESALIVRGSWYTRASRLDRWAQRYAFTDAWCSREPAEQAARKIVTLIEAGVSGIVNIGGARRTFEQILLDEGYTGFGTRPRAASGALVGDAPYAFPADTSVSTAKFDALELAWRDV